MNLTYQSIGLRPVKVPKYRGTKIWNALDEELKSTANLKHFKSKLKARFLGGNKSFTFQS